MGYTVGYLGVDLESRDIKMRTRETNLGSFICDLMRTEYQTDFAICNAGSFRKNGIIPAGDFSLLGI